MGDKITVGEEKRRRRRENTIRQHRRRKAKESRLADTISRERLF